MITLFKRFEFWNRSGAWKRPDEWVFSIERNCHSGCVVIELGFFGVSILRNGCQGDS